MTIMSALSLNTQEQQIVVDKIKDRVISKFNLAADFSKLNASKVDFTPEEVQAKEKLIGSQFIVPIRTFEGLDGDVHYVELKNSYFYNVATKTKNTTLLKTLRQSTTNNNEKLERIINHLKVQGYSIKKEEEYVIQNEKTAFEKEVETYSESTKLFILPIYKKEVEIGLLAIDEGSNIPVAFIDQERTFINEDNEIVTIQANTCSLKWARCMDQELCYGIVDCLIWGSSCIGMCCSCANPLICIGCISCGVKLATAAWTCRMCVSNASRPNECPVK